MTPRIEFLSALLRRFRNKEIKEEKLDEAISGFNETIVSFNVEPLGQAIIREAESLMRKAGKRQGIRTLDALHIGTFTLISGDDWVFVAADKTVCGIIQSILLTFNQRGGREGLISIPLSVFSKKCVP